MNMLAFLLNVIAPAVNLRSALLSPSRCFLSSAPALSFTAGAINFFGRDIEQIITLPDIEALTEQIERVRARRNRMHLSKQRSRPNQP
jgi:hypothetical protein